jgi:hypothetical protein
MPYFHDAYKIWSCCQKKSTDFTTWLSLPGCTKGRHNPDKPKEEIKIPTNGTGGDQTTTVTCQDEVCFFSAKIHDFHIYFF